MERGFAFKKRKRNGRWREPEQSRDGPKEAMSSFVDPAVFSSLKSIRLKKDQLPALKIVLRQLRNIYRHC